MASTKYLPTKEQDLKVWAQNASAVLTANPTGYGQTAAVATQLAAKVTAFVNALDAWTTPETRTPVALQTKQTAKEAMIAFVRPLVRQIQASPGVTNAMRSAMGITVPKTPSWPGNPGTPTNFKAELTALGGLDLSWKCTNPAAGTMYAVWRQLGPTGQMVQIGGSGQKKFTDSTVPAGTAQVTYHIQAQRTTGAGAWSAFVVNLGVAPSGTTVQSVTQTAAKIAA